MYLHLAFSLQSCIIGVSRRKSGGEKMNKTMNVLGIIMAWILSIVLVVMLIATPLAFTALSLVKPETIIKVVTDTLVSGIGMTDPQPSAQGAELITLSGTTQAGKLTPVDNADIGTDVLDSVFGDYLTQEQLSKLLSSKAAKELVEVYTKDLTGAFSGDNTTNQFDAEKVKAIVNDNIDEIVDIAQEVVPELAEMDKEELKSNIQKAINEGAEQLVQAIPKPQEIQKEIVESNPELELALKIVAKKNTIELAIIGVIILLSALIFVCRLCGFRGFRWLAVDLFVGTGFGVLFCVGLLVGTPMLKTAMAGDAVISGLVGSLMSAFTKGMIVRTVVMLIAGGAMLTAYILIKKQRAKKSVAEEIEETAEEAVTEEITEVTEN